MKNIFLTIMKQQQSHWFRKTILSVFLLIAVALQASVMSQKVSLDLKNATIREALSILETQIDYTFLYDAEQIDLSQTVNIKEINTELNIVLTKLFTDKEMTYQILNKHIIITPVYKSKNKILPRQLRTIQGKVTDAITKEPLIGVNIKLKGTGTGTISDFDGNYTISANSGDVLVFTYVGFSPKEVIVDNSNTLNVTMETDTEMLAEVVVTAMGVKSEKKKLNFAVSTLNADDIISGQSENFINGMQGKVAGINVTNSGGSPNSGANIIIRGISSINTSQNNQPLFVLDGMAIRGTGSNMVDFNPNDIADITILKGAAASALYGQEAANGVIMITTKSGKMGKVTTTVNASVELVEAARTPQIQTKYSPGTKGVINKFPSGGWGPLIQSGETIYDNVNNFLKTGLLQRYSGSISGGDEKYSLYGSVSYSNNEGIVPEDYAKRFNFMIKGDVTISKNLKASIQSTVSTSQSRGFGNSMSSIYSWPINDDITNYITPDGKIRWRNNPKEMNNLEKIDNPLNPLWRRYMDGGKSSSTRNLVLGSLTWSPLKQLQLTSKFSYDGVSSNSESFVTPRYSRKDFEISSPTEDPLANNLSLLGAFYSRRGENALITWQNLINFGIDINENWSLSSLLGTELKMNNWTNTKMSGLEFRMPGIYSFMNTIHQTPGSNNELSMQRNKKRTAGIFTELRADYKGLVQLSGTYRKDYTSTLEKKSYDYSSLTGGIIFSELFDIKNRFFTYGKLRGNWARVGKDMGPYHLSPSFTIKNSFPDPGYAINPVYPYGIGIKPELNDSWEIGADLRFFENKTRVDFAYYSTIADNQIVTVRVSPAAGSILQIRNEGKVKNHGIEISLDQDIIKNKTLSWISRVNFSFNRGTVEYLPDQLTEIQGTQFGDIFPTSYLHGSTTALSGLDYLRNEKGRIIINSEGYPKRNPAKGNLIGNREPDFLIGFMNNLKYKNISLDFLIDIRKGGDVANITERSLIVNGMSKFHETYRNREFLFEGVVKQPDGSYLPNTKSVILDQQTINTYIYGVSSNFIEDGSYIRLSHVTLSYDLSHFNFIKRLSFNGLRASFTGRNLLLLTKYTGGDPQINANTSARGSGQGGIDNFGVPSTRNFNFSIHATF